MINTNDPVNVIRGYEGVLKSSDNHGEIAGCFTGLTIRQQLAKDFMCAIISKNFGTEDHTSDADLAESSFMLADAFIKVNNEGL